MIEFRDTTTFGLVRRLALAGRKAPSLFLLTADSSAIDAVRDELIAEMGVQLGSEPKLLSGDQIPADGVHRVFRSNDDWPMFVVTIDKWRPKIMESLDRNVVLFAGIGIVLFLTEPGIGERTLACAPNLRSRLTDVLAISPE